MIYVTELLLYICFCILVGTQLLRFVPTNKRPAVSVPNWLVYLSITGITVLSLSPIIEVTLMFAKEYEVGIWTIFEGILFDFTVGNAWLITFFISLLLFVVVWVKNITKTPILEKIGAFLTFGLVLAFAWASHCTASYQLKGFIPHASHFLAVTIWIGTLFIIGWFSKNTENWGAFLKWFSPLALLCVIITISAGFFLMNLLVPSYVDSWIISYGQALLIKHLLIVPLLIFAFINGILLRRKLKSNSKINPIPWVRAESVVALLVLSAMAVMGQQSPPDNIAAIIQFENPSWLFDVFYNKEIVPTTTIDFNIDSMSIAFASVALIFLAAMILVFQKRLNSMLALACGIFFVVSLYSSLMVGIN